MRTKNTMGKIAAAKHGGVVTADEKSCVDATSDTASSKTSGANAATAYGGGKVTNRVPDVSNPLAEPKDG